MCRKDLLSVFSSISLLILVSCEKDSAESYESVDLGLSVKWATCNVGASNPWECGRYFAWGDVKGQTWYGSFWSGGGFSTKPTYEINANGDLKPEYDAAHVNLGGTWRMPTHAEQQELIDNCTRIWSSNYLGSGVAGYLFTSNKNGKSIFLPAAGGGMEGDLKSSGSGGYYWSSTFFYDGDEWAWSLCFISSNAETEDGVRSYGLSVRPVTE